MARPNILAMSILNVITISVCHCIKAVHNFKTKNKFLYNLILIARSQESFAFVYAIFCNF
jgi:hypothetical protein